MCRIAFPSNLPIAEWWRQGSHLEMCTRNAIPGSMRCHACYDARVELRTSVKVIKIGYLLCVILAVAIAAYLLAIHNQDERMWALLAIPALGLIILAIRHMRRRLIKLTILDDRL